MEENKILIKNLVCKNKHVELELSNHSTNYDYSLLKLEANGRHIYFEFKDSEQIEELIDKLKDLQTHLDY